MENTFGLGDVVVERVRPNQRLIITQQHGKIYYCVPLENTKRKAFAFHARDLKGGDANG